MAEIVVSSFLSVIFEKLASAALQTLAPYVEMNSEIKKLERSLFRIRSVLTDASQKEITNQSVKRWLNGIQHLAYDIDDILDEIATEAMHRELNDESETNSSKVIKILPNPFSKHALWDKTIKDKINAVTTKLQELIEEKDALGLSVTEETSTRSRNRNRRLQTSLVHEPSIVGRQGEKDALIHKLLENEPCDHNFSIVPIVGMGGMGKTTLARLVYNEKQVMDHFEHKAWVCVSDDFDSFAISTVIFEYVAGVNKKFADLGLLQEALKDHLREKKFLFVLDDVWSESCEDWETLVKPFYACAPGSKIIMTTRKDKLLKMLGYSSDLNQLQRLSHDDALSLLALHAFGVNNFDSHLSLKPHGEGIVEKCDGLPLALVALGRLLRTKNDEEEYWEEVLNSETWRLQDVGGIVPALRLSYHDLSASLKQLFAYCSLFPKDHMFYKDTLVKLWMAEGFLHRSSPNDSRESNPTEERMGHEYFDELLSRSFFQHAPNYESLYVMHDLMSDLATSVGGTFFLRFDNETEKDIENKSLEKYRHMSFLRESYVAYKKFETFQRAKSLRTFMVTSVGAREGWRRFYLSDKILIDLLPALPLLRVLCLEGFYISEVPESIGALRHLRYLNLSGTGITQLHENVSNLYNLQTLIIVGCRKLTKLPNNFLKLKKLRHLEIRDTPLLNHMPLGIGELKNLQTLSKFIIRGESGFKITELKNLKSLCGKISIVGLDTVQNAIHAREANFSQKRFSDLEFIWGDLSDGSRNEMLEKEVMNELKPHNSLKQLTIGSYMGLEFPNWVGDSSFLQLTSVSIRDCKKCTSLPPFGQLPLIKKLFIEGLDGVNVVGLELLGTSLAFPSLQILSFVNMLGWEKWSNNSGVVFPCLQQLVITNCINLVDVSLEALPSLNVLRIEKCENGVLRSLVEVASTVTNLSISRISGLNDAVWRGVREFLGVVEALSISNCDEIRYLWESEVGVSNVLVNLRTLYVFACNNLVSLRENEEDNCRSNLLTSLTTMYVSACKNMKCCRCPDNIESLHVSYCSSITAISLPTRLQKLKTLKIWDCKKLLERKWGGEKMNRFNSMPMLQDVWISDWPNLKSIIELDYFVRLTELKIENCERLESFPDYELPNLPLLKYLTIRNCPSMDASFPHGFWPSKLRYLQIGKLKKSISEWGPQNFPSSLVHLSLYGEDVSDCSQFSHIIPSSLTSLYIYDFEELKSVSMGLEHLASLQHLYFTNCPNMMGLPEMLLPSLLSLRIRNNCPILKERCSKRGCYWPLISHIPCIDLDPSSKLPWSLDEIEIYSPFLLSGER